VILRYSYLRLRENGITTRGIGVLLFLSALLSASICFDAQLSQSGDNAEFIILARSLSHTGEYQVDSTPDPQPATKFPPLFPGMLALVEWVAPGSIPAMKWLIVLFYAASIPVIFKLFQEQSGTPHAWLVSATCLVSPYLLDLSHEVMSEVPFLALSAAAVLVASREDRGWRSLAAILALVMAAYYVRTAGIALMVAVLLYDARLGKWRSVTVLATGMVLLSLPWTLYLQSNGGGIYGQALLLVDPYRPQLGYIGAGDAIGRVMRNLFAYGQLYFGRMTIPLLSVDSDDYGYTDALGHGIVMICLAAHAYEAVRKGISLPTLYLAVYSGMLLCWPEAWSGLRFLIPVAPFVFHVHFRGAQDLLCRLSLSALNRTRLTVVLVTAVLGVNTIASGAMAMSREVETTSWRDYYAAARWIRDHTQPNALIACRKPHLMFLESHRKSVRYAFDTPEAIIRDLGSRRVTHLVMDTFGEFDSNIRFLFPAIEKHKRLFNQLHKFESASVLEVHPNPADGYAMLIDHYSRSGDRESQADAMRKLFDLYPEQWATGIQLARFYFELGRPDEAREVLGRLVQAVGPRILKPEGAEIGLQLADIYQENGLILEARAVLGMLLPITDPVLLGGPIDSLTLNLSDRICQLLVRVEPENPAFLNAAAVTKLQLGRLKEGIASLIDLAATHPGEPTYGANLAVGLVLAGRHRDALNVALEVVGHHPDFIQAYALVAETQDILGNPGAAEEARRMGKKMGKQKSADPG